MYNHWKLATIGMALVLTTALITGVTTAYFTRPTDGPAVVAPAPLAVAATPPVLARRTAQPMARPVAAEPVTSAPVTSAPAPAASLTRTVATVPTDCSTGGDRALRIAKPGAVGGLVGAGLGAAGAAIAGGGKAAGQGALIGGLAGAVLGSGYGAYQTKNECGTIFGTASGFNAAPAAHADGVQALAPAAARSGDRIQVYGIER